MITVDRLDMPMLGYNVIKELVKMASQEGDFTPWFRFTAGFAYSNESRLEALISLIQAQDNDYLCSLRTSKRDTVIPQGQTVKVSCTTNTGPVSTNILVLFEPDELSQWSTGLEIYETLKTVKKWTVSWVDIDVHNTSDHNIVLPYRTPLGRLHLIKSVTPTEVKPAETDDDRESGSQYANNSSTSTEEEDTKPNDTIPEVDMTGLTMQQQEVVRKMLKEESAYFASNDDGIGYIEDLQMDIEFVTRYTRPAKLCLNPKASL